MDDLYNDNEPIPLSVVRRPDAQSGPFVPEVGPELDVDRAPTARVGGCGCSGKVIPGTQIPMPTPLVAGVGGLIAGYVLWGMR